MESENSSSALSRGSGDITIHRYDLGGQYNNGVRVSDASTSVAILNHVAGLNLDGSQKVGSELKAPPSSVISVVAAVMGIPAAAAERALPPHQAMPLTDERTKNLRIQQRLAVEKQWIEWLREHKEKLGMSGLLKLLSASDCPRSYNNPSKERLRAKLVRILLHDPNTAPLPEKTTVSVYRINDLSHPDIRHKVQFKALDYQLAGCAVITVGISVVVVGGEEKAVARYGKLMLRRIKWTARAPSNIKTEAQDGDKKKKKAVNKCVLVWQGTVGKPSFNRFSVHFCMTKADARQVFLDAGVTDYWDLALNISSEEEEE